MEQVEITLRFKTDMTGDPLFLRDLSQHLRWVVETEGCTDTWIGVKADEISSPVGAQDDDAGIAG